MPEFQQEQYPYYPYGQQTANPQDLSLVEQTNPKEVLKEIEMTLKGMTYDYQKEEWKLLKDAQPIVNDLGVNSLMTDARPFINQISTLSNISIDQISKIVVNLGRTVKNKLKMNWKEFGIDKSNLSTVVFAITNPAFMTGLRAMGEGERRFLKTSVRAVESYTSNATPQQSASSTTEKLKFWR